MRDFFSLVDSNNRVKYVDIKEYFSKTPLGTYISDVGMPFLIGKELFDGDISKADDGINTSTMRFRISELDTLSQKKSDPASEAPAISRAVFILKKCANSDEPRPHVFSLGRCASNDMTIPDYVISRKHAAIHCAAGRFFIEDLGSTNGVQVDGKPVGQGDKVMLRFGADISFGRYCFVFTSPIDLYHKVQKSL